MPLVATLDQLAVAPTSTRRGGVVPAAWRLGPAILAAALATRFAPWSLSLAAILALAALHALLARHGSTQATAQADPWAPPARRFRWAGFLAGTAAFANFLLLALVPLVFGIDDPARRQTIAAVLAATLLLAAAMAMGAQGWRWPHAAALGGGALLALAAATAFATETPAHGDWTTGFARLAFVFLLAEILVPGRGPRLGLLGAAQAVLAWLLLSLAQRLPADVAAGGILEPWAWWTIVGLLGAFLTGTAWTARRAFFRDVHWMLRGYRLRPMAPGMAATAGFVPTAALAPLAGWGLWSVSLTLAVAGAIGTRWAWRRLR